MGNSEWSLSSILGIAFPSFFLLEIIIRFGAFHQKLDCVRDPWFVFDATIVIVAGCDMAIIYLISANHAVSTSQIIKVVKVVRITRMARLAKLVQLIPELMVLIRGVFRAIRSVMCGVFLLLVIIYVFAVYFVTEAFGTPIQESYFPSVLATMTKLFVGTI